MSDEKVVGQIITVGKERVAIVGGTLADLLDLNNWTEIKDGKVVNPGKGQTTIIVGQPKRR